MKEFELRSDSGHTTTTLIQFDGEGPTVLLAHGAGTSQRHRMTVELATALAEAGFGVCTFDYPYAAAGRRAPDRPLVLMSAHLAAVEWVRQNRGESPVLAGRSMGGRIGTMLAAEPHDVPAVIAYGYPLHPAGRPEKLRIDHLESIRVPSLFFRGERDAFSRPDLFDQHVRSLRRATVVDLPGEGHSLTKPGTARILAERSRAFVDAL